MIRWKGRIGMEELIFRHMETVRGLTLRASDAVPEGTVDRVPAGFSNSIRWNFGHIAFVQERLVYEVMGEDSGLPDTFREYFAAGTSPAGWTGAPPSMQEIRAALAAQPGRIRESRKKGTDEPLLRPFTNKMGVTFRTSGETLLFSLYHEGLHLETIKRIARLAVG
ncbi:DinB family protein [Edaphobacillus lindanitolerans]|uniref:DinB superfamily protein n=1 Tax=Edaphobacillus lindanitolerans TaxID=550447 RepID=A0A1U7PSJ0_9BACI|nr:DinB family protein [Edaphobacillus lindanitolerans]SIT89606.1 DinB superfamily protein [Edaphobacillus lindanitolerans]